MRVNRLSFPSIMSFMCLIPFFLTRCVINLFIKKITHTHTHIWHFARCFHFLGVAFPAIPVSEISRCLVFDHQIGKSILTLNLYYCTLSVLNIDIYNKNNWSRVFPILGFFLGLSQILVFSCLGLSSAFIVYVLYTVTVIVSMVNVIAIGNLSGIVNWAYVEHWSNCISIKHITVN